MSPRTPIPLPAATDYPTAFAAYVTRVPDIDVLAVLEHQIDDTLALVSGLTDADARFRYAPAKWSIKEMIGHLADAERIFVYRALAFARAEAKELPGFDEDAYVANSRFDARPLASLLAELRSVRASTVSFFAGLDAAELARRGVANGRAMTVGALAAVIAGHELHHRAALEERYLPALKPR